jgi:hypothetical protein
MRKYFLNQETIYCDRSLILTYLRNTTLWFCLQVGFSVPWDATGHNFFQAFLASAPRHPILMVAFGEMATWYESRQYLLCSAYITTKCRGSSINEELCGFCSNLMDISGQQGRYDMDKLTELQRHIEASQSLPGEDDNWMGPSTLHRAWENYHAQLNENPGAKDAIEAYYGTEKLLREADLMQNDIAHEQVEPQNGYGLCNYGVVDPDTEKVLMWSRLVSSGHVSNSNCAKIPEIPSP